MNRVTSVLRLARGFVGRFRVLFKRHAQVAFSQEGEDLLLGRMFGAQTEGFFVDVGAHHPTRFSNTHLLYRRGWRGINVDATPGSMKAFRRQRRRDINLEVAVAEKPGEVELFMFDEGAINTLSEDLAKQHEDDFGASIREVRSVEAVPLSEILAAHLPDGVTIDLLTVDVEGSDFEVLRSNDWSRFRPRVLVIEVLGSSVMDLERHDEIRFLIETGYVVYAKLRHSVVLIESEAADRSQGAGLATR